MKKWIVLFIVLFSANCFAGPEIFMDAKKGTTSSWHTVFDCRSSASPIGAGQYYGNRYLVPANYSQYSGSKIRITYYGGASASYYGYNFGICENGTFPSCNGNVTQITAPSLTVAAGLSQLSNEIDFNFDKTKAYILTEYHQTESYTYYVSTFSNINRWYKSGESSDDSQLSSVTGGSTLSNTISIILKFEVYGP